MNGEEKIQEEEEEDDERRESAIASTQPLQLGFKPTRISQDQLSKLHELHRRRLKVKSKFHKKLKDGAGRSYSKDMQHDEGKSSVTDIEHSKASNMKSYEGSSVDDSAQEENAAAYSSQKKRQKLYWGLDTRERWERKANM